MQDVTVPMLWVPIVLAAVVVMIGSSVVWMALKYENAEWKPIANEDQLREVVRKLGLAPGQYIFPHMANQAPDLAAKKMEEGPAGVLLLRKPSRFSMSAQLYKSFIYYLVVSFFVAYVTSHALDRGAEYLRVFQVAGSSGFMAYSLALVPEAIWFGRSWKSVSKGIFSGLIYGCLTAGTFGWLWPR